MKPKRVIQAQVQSVVSLPYDIFMSLLVAVMLADDEQCRKSFRVCLPYLPEEIKHDLREKAVILKEIVGVISKS